MSKGLKTRVKKYGVFQELFFVDGQEVKCVWAICNKRFVITFLRSVVAVDEYES